MYLLSLHRQGLLYSAPQYTCRQIIQQPILTDLEEDEPHGYTTPPQPNGTAQPDIHRFLTQTPVITVPPRNGPLRYPTYQNPF